MFFQLKMYNVHTSSRPEFAHGFRDVCAEKVDRFRKHICQGRHFIRHCNCDTLHIHVDKEIIRCPLLVSEIDINPVTRRPFVNTRASQFQVEQRRLYLALFQCKLQLRFVIYSTFTYEPLTMNDSELIFISTTQGENARVDLHVTFL